MTTAEKLKRIKERCEELLRSSNASELSNAAWRSTIAAIERCKTLREIGNGDSIVGDSVVAAVMFFELDIIAAWPEELL